MQTLVPPFVWSLRFSTPAVADDELCFESYHQFFSVDPEEDYSEFSLLKQATQQRRILTGMLLDAARAHETMLAHPTPPGRHLSLSAMPSVNHSPAQEKAFQELVLAIDEYLSTLLSVFALLNEVQSNTISTTSSTSESFSMSSLSSSLSSALESSTKVDNKDDFGVVRRPGVGWTSTLHSNSSRSWAGDLALEVVAVLANKAVALVLRATIGGEDRLTKPMCGPLQEAAGLYDWIATAKYVFRLSFFLFFFFVCHYTRSVLRPQWLTPCSFLFVGSSSTLSPQTQRFWRHARSVGTRCPRVVCCLSWDCAADWRICRLHEDGVFASSSGWIVRWHCTAVHVSAGDATKRSVDGRS